jgi:hypothetical protein
VKNKDDDSKAAAVGVQELCRKLKLQLEELATDIGERKTVADQEDAARRARLMEQLKQQLADLSV